MKIKITPKEELNEEQKSTFVGCRRFKNLALNRNFRFESLLRSNDYTSPPARVKPISQWLSWGMTTVL
jgi:hypothetical protein